jgi:hypothetical protein
LSRSPWRSEDLALAQALGAQFKYLPRSDVELFFPEVRSASIGRHLGTLVREEWILKQSQPNTGLKHPPALFSLGPTAVDWLRAMGLPRRWSTRDVWKAQTDPFCAHWLGIATVWAQLLRFARSVPGVELREFQTELDYRFGSLDARRAFKPDFLFVLTWGPAATQALTVLGEFDRDTEPVTRFVAAKMNAARSFKASGHFPFTGPVDYWIIAPSARRLEALAGPERRNLLIGPFGSNSGWFLIPFPDWQQQGVWGSQTWITQYERRTSHEDLPWNRLVAAVNSRSGPT